MIIIKGLDDGDHPVRLISAFIFVPVFVLLTKGTLTP